MTHNDWNKVRRMDLARMMIRDSNGKVRRRPAASAQQVAGYDVHGASFEIQKVPDKFPEQFLKPDWWMLPNEQWPDFLNREQAQIVLNRGVALTLVGYKNVDNGWCREDKPAALDCDGAALKVRDWVSYAPHGQCCLLAYEIDSIHDSLFVLRDYRGDGELNVDPCYCKKLTPADGYYVKTGKVLRGSFEGAPEDARWLTDDPNGRWAWSRKPSIDNTNGIDEWHENDDDGEGDEHFCKWGNHYHDGDWQDSLLKRCVRENDND